MTVQMGKVALQGDGGLMEVVVKKVCRGRPGDINEKEVRMAKVQWIQLDLKLTVKIRILKHQPLNLEGVKEFQVILK